MLSLPKVMYNEFERIIFSFEKKTRNLDLSLLHVDICKMILFYTHLRPSKLLFTYYSALLLKN